MIMSSETSREILVRLTGISQELTVGVGAAIASVRTLTDFSLVIRARELIVLSGSSGAGERAVLAVIAGDRRGVSGTREVHNSVRLRSLRMSASSALALAQEWQRAELEALTGDTASHRDGVVGERADAETFPTEHPADVFLLDVVAEPLGAVVSEPSHTPAKKLHWRSVAGATTRGASSRSATTRPASARNTTSRNAPPASWNEKNREALYNWAVVCRRRGGAIAMAANEEFGLRLINADLARSHRASSGERTVVREDMRLPGAASRHGAHHTQSTVSLPTSAVRERPVYLPSMRVVAMHCGRLAASIPIPLPAQPMVV